MTAGGYRCRDCDVSWWGDWFCWCCGARCAVGTIYTNTGWAPGRVTCWSEGPSEWGDAIVPCRYEATEPLGLCVEHQAELCGDLVPA